MTTPGKILEDYQKLAKEMKDKEPPQAPALMGWMCPKCGGVYGPFVSMCGNCTPMKITFTAPGPQ